jgi:GR25 family glycosyltransferase involved in LPS biosynthesis
MNINDVYAAYANLSIRPDRNEKMIAELNRSGISAERFDSLLPAQVREFIPDNKLQVMQNRTPGAIGCHYSQVAIMEKALSLGKTAWVMEDDLVYCDDIQDRLTTIFDFLSTHEWDIFWFGGTWHNEPTWHKSENGHHTHPDLQMCTCDLNRDWEPTEHPNIVRTYGAFSTHSYLVNVKSLPKILDLLDQNVYRSMGIDWIMLLIQPQLHAYAFTPGCCKQYDNQSNIGTGMSIFSGFVNLGPHWFKDRL